MDVADTPSLNLTRTPHLCIQQKKERKEGEETRRYGSFDKKDKNQPTKDSQRCGGSDV
jgi:hypothetical protein